MQAAIDALIGGAADQDLAAHWEPYNSLCETHDLAMVLYLASHMVHLYRQHLRSCMCECEDSDQSLYAYWTGLRAVQQI